MEPKEVIIQLQDEDRLIEVPVNKSIMQAALDAGVKLIHSCLKGQCGSCRAYVVSGEVEMRNNFSLFEEEVKAGQVLLCQSYPISDEVVINPIRKPII
jgi:ring-1,2-phenylacetyl-CoA epoxidase subunit PaaE